jgi:hypothetical protein
VSEEREEKKERRKEMCQSSNEGKQRKGGKGVSEEREG